ncbi:MAG: DUF924 family protein [Bacteriovoracaceae bacterium]|nr:DUF924 family protein [Bacteriovoracaceae bacterium]
MNSERIQLILSFWFGRDENFILSSERLDLWFSARDKDFEMDRLFSSDILLARRKNSLEWEKDIQGRLALILILTQIAKKINPNDSCLPFDYRYTSFLSLRSISEKKDIQLPIIQRAFLYVPLMYSEKGEVREHAVNAYAHLLLKSPLELKSIMAQFYEEALSRLDNNQFFQKNVINF